MHHPFTSCPAWSANMVAAAAAAAAGVVGGTLLLDFLSLAQDSSSCWLWMLVFCGCTAGRRKQVCEPAIRVQEEAKTKSNEGTVRTTVLGGPLLSIRSIVEKENNKNPIEALCRRSA